MAHFVSTKIIIRSRGTMREAGWEPDLQVELEPYRWRRRWLISACMQRDFSTGCCWCQKPMLEDVHEGHPDRLTIEHVTRKADGGPDAYENSAVACFACNNGRHAGENHPKDAHKHGANYTRYITSGRRCSLVLRAIWEMAPHILPPLPAYDGGPGGLPVPYKLPDDWPYRKRENNRWRVEPIHDLTT